MIRDMPQCPVYLKTIKVTETHLALIPTYIVQSTLTKNKADIFIFICLIPTSLNLLRTNPWGCGYD